MKVLVLGAKGFVGSAFVRAASREGFECLGIDLDNYEAFRGRQADLLVNAAGNSKKYLARSEPREDFRISLCGLLDSFFDFGFRHYVYISSVDVYPDHEDPAASVEDTPIDVARISNYGFHKHLGEEMVRHYLPSWLIVRLGGVLGPGLKKNPVYDLRHGHPLRVDEESRYQYLGTDFLARAVYELARRERWNEVFNACGAGTVSLREIRLLMGAPLRYRLDCPPRERYEIDNTRLSGVVEIPPTRRTVEEFLASPDRPREPGGEEKP